MMMSIDYKNYLDGLKLSYKNKKRNLPRKASCLWGKVNALIFNMLLEKKLRKRTFKDDHVPFIFREYVTVV